MCAQSRSQLVAKARVTSRLGQDDIPSSSVDCELRVNLSKFGANGPEFTARGGERNGLLFRPELGSARVDVCDGREDGKRNRGSCVDGIDLLANIGDEFGSWSRIGCVSHGSRFEVEIEHRVVRSEAEAAGIIDAVEVRFETGWVAVVAEGFF